MSSPALDSMIRTLRDLPKVGEEVAHEAAPLLTKLVRDSAAAGRTIEGKPWPPRRDGSRALPNAASAISGVALGSSVVLTLSGPYVYHDAAEGPDRRRILPETGAGIPGPVASVLEHAASNVFRRRTGGRG
jgi:hypothetical protein